MNRFLSPRMMIPLTPLRDADDLIFAANLERLIKRVVMCGCVDHAGMCVENLVKLVVIRKRGSRQWLS